ncbi:MAG: hypothetical protein U0Q22_08395 [Acidimicrobiales bacterium]
MTDDLLRLQLQRLRLAAALVHATPHLALELSLPRGARLLVSHDASVAPDVDACEFRELVGRLAEQGPLLAGFGWIRDIAHIDVVGVGATIDADVVTTIGPQRGASTFVTTLSPIDVQASARGLAQDLIAVDPSAVVALRDVRVEIHHDDRLDVSVVTLPATNPDDVDDTAFIAAAIARRCRIDEFVHTAFAPST